MAQLPHMDFRSNALSSPARVTARLIALLAFAALVAQMLATMAANPDDSLGQVLWNRARYFTNLTAVLTLLTFLGMSMSGGGVHRLWIGGITLWEALTGVIYHALLGKPLTGIDFWASHGLHTVLPVAVFLWWACFGRKTPLRMGAAIAWLSWPALYILYALARGNADGRYPYFFLDPGQVRWDGVAVWSGIIGLAFFAGGLVLIFLARLIRR
ncbi:MAG: hypothetical protein GYB53_00565 [Rhodobacteraceae bacterium]|nr:hypothetical protein [Paracoccaceae bacterium]MBR9821602.1 hypothetical protein [Paracoccaceae bacterium]